MSKIKLLNALRRLHLNKITLLLKTLSYAEYLILTETYSSKKESK